MDLESFLTRLDGVQKEGAGYMACCPAHKDKNPSMSVSAGRNGGIVVHCHAGCPAENIVEAMGLRMSDLMPDRDAPPLSPVAPEKKRGAKKLGKRIADYIYKDVDGVVRFKVSRYDPKDFRQYSPDPNDPSKWVFGVASKGVKYIPYNLPAVHAAASAHKVIFIAEGEKDVDALGSIGITASCNVGGVGKGWQADYCRYFQGAARIIVIADNDAGPESGKKEYWQGQRHAVHVRNMFRSAGFKADAMVLPQRGDRPVKDAHDWIVAGGDKAALIEAVKNLPPWPTEWEALASDVPGTGADDGGGGDTEKKGSMFGRPARRPRSLDELVPYAVDYSLSTKKK